jgi:hypothetical protein
MTEPGLDGFAPANSARSTPIRETLKQTRRRRLKNADRDVDFFCITRLTPTPFRIVLCEIRESVTRK